MNDILTSKIEQGIATDADLLLLAKTLNSNQDNLLKHDSCKGNNINNVFICETCFKTFDKLKNLKRHEKLHQEDSKKFVCTFKDCGKAYSRSDHLKRHLISHSEDKKPFSCTKCIQRFSSKDHLTRHFKNVHSQNEEITETETNTAIKEDKVIDYYNITDDSPACKSVKNTNHEKSDLKNFQDIHNCKLCNKTYYKRNSLTLHYFHSHLEHIHNDSDFQAHNPSLYSLLTRSFNKIKNCPFPKCKRLFSSVVQMKNHIRRTHDRLKRLNHFSCNSNGYRTATELLVSKTRINRKNKRSLGLCKLLSFNHNNKLVYVCSVEGCRKSYSSRYNLKVHIKNSHIGETSFTCSFCQKGFKHKCSLRLHLAKQHNVDLRNNNNNKVINHRQEKVIVKTESYNIDTHYTREESGMSNNNQVREEKDVECEVYNFNSNTLKTTEETAMDLIQRDYSGDYDYLSNFEVELGSMNPALLHTQGELTDFQIEDHYSNSLKLEA